MVINWTNGVHLLVQFHWRRCNDNNVTDFRWMNAWQTNSTNCISISSFLLVNFSLLRTLLRNYYGFSLSLNELFHCSLCFKHYSRCVQNLWVTFWMEVNGIVMAIEKNTHTHTDTLLQSKLQFNILQSYSSSLDFNGSQLKGNERKKTK